MAALRIALPELGQNMKNYVAALKGAGMEPVVISVQHEQLADSTQQEYLDYSDVNVDLYDGLLLPGGGDIDPRRYGQENRGCIFVMEELDELQFDILDKFVRQGKPVFGICRGMQMINVYFGGTLIQDIKSSFRHFVDGDLTDKIHESTARSGSWIADVYGPAFVHNSAHHQAVDQAGSGIIIDQWSRPDWIVEAIHHEKLPVFGVQWHPERMCMAHAREDTVDGLAMLEFFADLCRRDARRRKRTAADQIEQVQAEMAGIMGL